LNKSEQKKINQQSVFIHLRYKLKFVNQKKIIMGYLKDVLIIIAALVIYDLVVKKAVTKSA